MDIEHKVENKHNHDSGEAHVNKGGHRKVDSEHNHEHLGLRWMFDTAKYLIIPGSIYFPLKRSLENIPDCPIKKFKIRVAQTAELCKIALEAYVVYKIIHNY